jgi:hypothetical protein
MELALRWIGEGRIDVKTLTAHRLALADIDTAVTAHIAAPDRTLGTLLIMPD